MLELMWVLHMKIKWRGNRKAFDGNRIQSLLLQFQNRQGETLCLARANNVHFTSPLRLVILMNCNTFSTLYKEGWQSMKREWRQKKVLPIAETELNQIWWWSYVFSDLRQQYKCICYGFMLFSEILMLTNLKEYFSFYYKTIFSFIVLLSCLHQKLSYSF